MSALTELAIRRLSTDESARALSERYGIKPSDVTKARAGKVTLEVVESVYKVVLEESASAKATAPAPAATPSSAPGAWEGRNLHICMPLRYNQINGSLMFGLLATFDKTRMRFTYETGSNISRQRNVLAKEFMRGGAEWCLMIDDDIVFPFGNSAWFINRMQLPINYPEDLAGVHAINRVVGHGRSLVGALYFQRTPTGLPAFAEGQANAGMLAESLNASAAAVPIETEWIGAGFMLIHRSVFTAIEEKFPHLAPKNDKDAWGYFTTDAAIGGNAGEDEVFCIRAKAAGHNAFVDLGCHVMHLGQIAYGRHNVQPEVET